jgi:hypothetical protein
VVNHDVVRLDITVHDALAVAEVESLEQLEDVVAHVVVLELGVEAPEVGVVDVFKDQRGRFALQGSVLAGCGVQREARRSHLVAVLQVSVTDLVVAHHIQQRHNVGAA